MPNIKFQRKYSDPHNFDDGTGRTLYVMYKYFFVKVLNIF